MENHRKNNVSAKLQIWRCHQPFLQVCIDLNAPALIVGFVQKLRSEELEKVPGIAETLDFAAALMGLGVGDLTQDPVLLQAALTTLLKTQVDQANVTTEVAQRLAGRAA